MDESSVNPLSTDPQQQVANPVQLDASVLAVVDPLALNIPDEQLEEIVSDRIKASQKFYEEKYNLSARRRKNELYLFGRQIAEQEKLGQLKDYETRSADNALYEIEATLKPLAMSQLPDVIVTPGQPDSEQEESAKDLSLTIDDMNKRREQREALALAFKHLPVYFTGILKARWDPELGSDGDYRFDVIHPAYVVMDHTATSKDQKDMGYIAQLVPMTVQEAFMKFPKHRQAFIAELEGNGIQPGQSERWDDLASEIQVWEVWFDWYRRKGADPDELVNREQMQATQAEQPKAEWEKIAGVLWKYEHCILDKSLDPNFDHEGEEKLFSYQDPSDEQSREAVSPERLFSAAQLGVDVPNLSRERIFHNYFQKPRKPYYFFGYDQWGKIPLDETSRLEQNIRNQENLDDQTKTILDQLKTRVKHIWSTDSGLDKAAVQRLDMDDPKLDVIVEGNPNEVHGQVDPERPDAAQFNALKDTRDRMYAISGSTALRGMMQSDTATTNQIAREADYTRTDDLVEDTINAACEWLAEWQMQFIKLRYTEDHLRQILGAKGEATYIRLRRDMISDGMEVMVKASSTDKLKAQRNAMDTAQLGPPFTNPLDFFTDMSMNDPEGRTERGMLFATDPMTYFAKYVLKLPDSAAQAMALQAQGAAAAPGQAPAPGTPSAPPQQPAPQNTATVAAQPPAGAPTGSPRAL